MSVLDYFIGTTQSKYVSIAIFLVILTMCVAILFTNTDVSLGMRFGIVLFLILISIFPVAISLFELTCIVTGGKNTKYNLCNYYAWFITVLVIIYSFILIIMIISSMFTYKKAQDKIVMTDNMKKISSGDANKIAEKMMREEFSASDAKAISQAVSPTPVVSSGPSGPTKSAEPSAPVPLPKKTDDEEETKPALPKNNPVGAGISGFANYMSF
jgi:hypothetical protein